MKIHGWLGSLALVSALACGGSNNDVKVSGTDPDSLRSSPAGTATLALVDMESTRPDDPNLVPEGVLRNNPGIFGSAQPVSIVVGCRAYNTVVDATTRTTTVTFTQCTAANGWILNGAVVFTSLLAQPESYTSVFNLQSQDASGTKTWTYTGTKLVTINSVQKTATISVTEGAFVTVAYQNSQDASKNKTYRYAPSLIGNWATPGQFKLMGSYTFQQVGGPTVTATVSSNTPLIWTPACCYPTSGTLTLTSDDATTTAVFGPECGALKLNGVPLPLTCQ